MNKKIVAIGADHGGFEDKEIVKKLLIDSGYEVIDVGTNSTDSCNYAEFGLKAAEVVANKQAIFGIVICGSGEGISIAANKVKGIRCGVGYDDNVSRLLRQHNNANMIAFGARFMKIEDILKRVDIFLNTDFEGGRHIDRVKTIENYEKTHK